MKKHYETHVEDTDKLISVAGPILEYKSWYEQYRKLMEEQAQRKYGLYTPTSEGDDDDFPSIPGMIARYSAKDLTNEQMAANPVWVDKTGNGHNLQMKNFAWKEGSGISDVYLGALVFDGVDDYGVCDNFPILTKEKGYTVVALRQWLSNKVSSTFVHKGTINSSGAFVFEFIRNNGEEDVSSFGKDNVIDISKSVFSYQTSNSYNGASILSGDNADGAILRVGTGVYANYTNVAIWEIVILDHDATEEELTKIKDYFVKTYPWLFPAQAWTVVGKTNEDTDRATIANITSNGNNLRLSNFGFIEGSGYNEEGEYAGYLVTDGVDDSGRAVNVTTEKDFTLVGEWKLFSDTSNNAGLSIHPQIHIFNRPESIQITFRSAGKTLPVKSLKAICSDGRCYDKDWNELHINVGNFTNNTGTLFVGSNGGNYTKTAFKNLSLYNNQIFSKEDCIKAYNYLQTLKAK